MCRDVGEAAEGLSSPQTSATATPGPKLKIVKKVRRSSTCLQLLSQPKDASRSKESIYRCCSSATSIGGLHLAPSIGQPCRRPGRGLYSSEQLQETCENTVQPHLSQLTCSQCKKDCSSIPIMPRLTKGGSFTRYMSASAGLICD